MDELERTAESPALSTLQPPRGKFELHDAESALRRAEATIGTKVLGDLEGEAGLWLAAAHEAASKGERVAVLARAGSLAASREGMRRIARERLGLVAHAVSGHGGEDLAALTDLGWGVLCASGPEDSADLTFIARRAAEDAGVPFLVVHALGHRTGGSGLAVAMASIPSEKAAEGFVGPASRLRARHDPGHPSLAPLGDRAFSERVPFALGSAMREFAAVSGRRHDLFERAPLGEPQLVLVGMGAVGDALIAATAELRARGYDVGAVHVTSLRPFPGARIIKALSRALAVSVLEPVDEPLAQGGLLARELKSAFTDAITWTPGFPGIGRVPKLFVGVTGHAFDIEDLAAICDNMLADERGRRSFSFAEVDHALPRPERVESKIAGQVAVRWVLDDAAVAHRALALTAAVLLETLGLRVHAIVSEQSEAVVVDLFATRDARGGMARRGPRLVIATDKGALRSDTMSPLLPGAVLGVLSAVGLSDASRAIARERRVRVLPLPIDTTGLEPALAVAATCAGATAAMAFRAQRAAVDPLQVARAVADHVKTLPHADVAAERARRAFEVAHEAVLAAEMPGPEQESRGLERR